MPQRGTSLAHQRPVSPTGTEGTTCPRHPPRQEGQDWPRGPPVRPPVGRGTPTGTRAQPQRATPLPRRRSTPPATSSITPTATAVPWHPGPAPAPPDAHLTGTAACTNPRRTEAAARAGPESVAPPAASARPRHPQPLTPDAPIPQRPPPAPSPPRPSTAGDHRPPTPRGALDGTTPSLVPRTHTYHHHQPLPACPPVPWCHTQPSHPHHHHHTVQHHLPPQLHGLRHSGHHAPP